MTGTGVDRPWIVEGMTSRQSTDTSAGDDAGMTTAELLAAADEALIDAAFCSGDFDEADRLASTARRQAEADGDRPARAAAEVVRGSLLHYRNITSLMNEAEPAPDDVAAEEAATHRSLELYQELGDEAGVARAAFGVGLFEQVLRLDWNAAMPYYRRSESLIPALEKTGDLYTRSEIHRHLGFYHLVVENQPETAVGHLRISLELREKQDEPRRIPSGLVALAWAQREAGNPAEAVRLLRRAVSLAREAGLIPARIADAERELRESEAELAKAEAPETAETPETAEN